MMLQRFCKGSDDAMNPSDCCVKEAWIRKEFRARAAGGQIRRTDFSCIHKKVLDKTAPGVLSYDL